ncbi:DUF4142 domain-containing protein [Cognatilysobacter bugurensis]|uniref:DUF4142 domain-containing protein n=1 Tax=Cognatilysobacter bugurensis TaxID=543356 RepID=A0A918SVQ9_9GAMM|nr:DUF4142 domain-containing protein [Lysobacter bugurensis]GHA72434.1 hypothetical protein GCM10007067_06160 [Lysobacter bugurensis]
MNNKTRLAVATAALMTLALGGCASTGMDAGVAAPEASADTAISGSAGSVAATGTAGAMSGATGSTGAATDSGAALSSSAMTGNTAISGSTAGTAAAGTASSGMVASGGAMAGGTMAGDTQAGASAAHSKHGGAMAGAGAPLPKASTPAEALTLVALVDQHELKLAQLTQSKQVSEPVMAYAKMMVAEHTPHLAKTRTLVDAAGGMQQKSEGAHHLMMLDQQTQQRLNGLQGDAYARAYIEHMVQSHQMGIAMLDASMSVATDASQREFMQMTKQVMQKHLEHAQKVQAQLRG